LKEKFLKRLKTMALKSYAAEKRIEIHKKINDLTREKMALPEDHPRRPQLSELIGALRDLLRLYKDIEKDEAFAEKEKEIALV
jgi:hypothetical protein